MKERNMLSIAPRTLYYFCTALLLCILSGNVFAGQTTRVSVSSKGVQAQSASVLPSISADGRIVAFWSYANNLVAGDTNGDADVFVHDRLTKQTTRVSVNSSGVQKDGHETNPDAYPTQKKISLSANGRYVAFASTANNLVAENNFHSSDVYVHDRVTHQTTRVSNRLNGTTRLSDNSYSPSISADGRYVAFSTTADLATESSYGFRNVYVHDRATHKNTLVSVNAGGISGNNASNAPSLSADGRYVAFHSFADNLILGDTNNKVDAFVHDRTTHKTTLVSVNSKGVQGNSDSGLSSISADGRYVAFWSIAYNLVAGYICCENIFVHDRLTKQTTMVSVNSSGMAATGNSDWPSISADGRYVAYNSNGANLVPGLIDSHGFTAYWGVFIHDRLTHKTTFATVDSNGAKGRGFLNAPPSLSADGRLVALRGDNLVAGNTSNSGDIYVRDRRIDTIHRADLKITTTKKPVSLVLNSNGAYTYTITNDGPDAVNNVNITHLVMSGGDGLVVNFTPSQGSCTAYATLNLCRMGNLLAGNSFTLQAVVKASGNPLVQKVTVRGEPVDAVPTNNLVSVSTTVTP